MQTDAKLINSLLLESADSGEAIAKLNRLNKSRYDYWSMQYVCKKAGISSTGYYSDIIKGRRRLHPKYAAGLQKVFGLSEIQSRYLSLLVERDQGSASQAVQAIDEDLRKIAEMMKFEFMELPAQLSQGLLWHVLVLSSFSLFPNNPTLKELEDFFGRSQSISLAKSLHRLTEMGLVAKVNDTYSLTNKRLIFKDSEEGFSPVQFIEASVGYAKDQVKHWLSVPTQSLILSTVVTVKRAQYESLLGTIRSQVMNILTSLDEDTGDQLVSFNIQLFPFDPRTYSENSNN